MRFVAPPYHRPYRTPTWLIYGLLPVLTLAAKLRLVDSRFFIDTRIGSVIARKLRG